MTNIIDIRSDTVTIPCRQMLDAILTAKVGDDFYKEDLTTLELENYCKVFFKKEAALFVVSGTMGNQIAIRCHTNPGDEIILDKSYHINFYEAGATADLGKVSINLVSTPDGLLKKEHIKKAFFNKHRSNLSSYPSLLCLENTIRGCLQFTLVTT